jgi:hypothetical protein
VRTRNNNGASGIVAAPRAREWHQRPGKLSHPSHWLPLEEHPSRVRALSSPLSRAIQEWELYAAELLEEDAAEFPLWIEPQITGSPPQVEQTFAELAQTWKRETITESVMMRAVMHSAYQQIIGLGPAAVPLILRELQREPNFWFWALTAITKEDPAADEDNLEGATARWLEWGHAHGYLP